MIYGIYSIFDTIGLTYMHPELAVNDNVAVRNFATRFANSESVYAMNPADFRLCKLGEFDPIKGIITPFDNPEVIIDGVSAKNMIGG